MFNITHKRANVPVKVQVDQTIQLRVQVLVCDVQLFDSGIWYTGSLYLDINNGLVRLKCFTIFNILTRFENKQFDSRLRMHYVKCKSM